jgi:TolA-binding protein
MIRPSSRSKKSAVHPLDTDRQRLRDEEEKIRLLEEKIRRQEEEARRKLENLPKELEERKRRQQELHRLHLVSAPTRADGLSKLRDKRHPLRQKSITVSGGKRMAERRAARMQFILLCLVLGIILLLLWKSLPSS